MIKNSTLFLKDNGPFYDLVMVFQGISASLITIINDSYKINLPPEAMITWESKAKSNFGQHFNEIVDTCKTKLTNDDFSFNLSCMLCNLAFEKVKKYNTRSPEFEFFRHIRNASSHRNNFYFTDKEPKNPSEWGGIVIDHCNKGQQNILFGVQCFGRTINSGDLLYLLYDIEQQLPDECFLCDCC